MGTRRAQLFQRSAVRGHFKVKNKLKCCQSPAFLPRRGQAPDGGEMSLNALPCTAGFTS